MNRPGNLEFAQTDALEKLKNSQLFRLLSRNAIPAEFLSLNRLGERCNASIVAAHGNLFIRTHKHLWCIGAEGAPK